MNYATAEIMCGFCIYVVITNIHGDGPKFTMLKIPGFLAYKRQVGENQT